MKGIRLSSLTGELYTVARKHDTKPVDAIQNTDEKLGHWKGSVLEAYGDNFVFLKNYYQLQLKMLGGFSFDELCKLRYSSIFTMEKSIDKLFETNPRYEIVRKIQSSMWRWGYGRGSWNQLVNAYENIRKFSFVDDPDFELRLDYTTYNNEFGYSKYSRTFLDGVFAFLVYYKNKHVMTIGFSVLEKRRILIQQVQSAVRIGNRYLFRLPQNRLEFVIGLFHKNFSGYTFSVIDGKCLVKKTLSDYRRGLSSANESCKRLRGDLVRPDSESKSYAERALKDYEQLRQEFSARIDHLKKERERIVSFYRNTGKFRLGQERKHLGLTHHQVLINS